MDICICMAKSLHCSPKTITTLLVGYTQYKMFVVLKNNNNEFFFKLKGKKKNWRICAHTYKKKSESLCISYKEIKVVLFLEQHIFPPMGIATQKFTLEPPVSLVNMKLKQGELTECHK